MGTSRTRLLICDDHPLIQEGIHSLVQSEYEVIGTVDNGRDAVSETIRLQPDILILDVGIPLLNGVEAARQIRAAVPSTKILFLSQQSDREYLVATMSLGADGYVLKSGVAGEIRTALSEILQGRIYISAVLRRGLSPDLIDPHRDAEDLFGGRLTPRQREVLQLVAEGKSGKEVAALLHISIKTVDFHKAGIMDVLGLRTTAELTRYAIRNKIA